MNLNEASLRANDLRDLVRDIFEVDSYKSKMGEDKDVSVLSFEVDVKEAAEDLVNFIEKGFEFVLDADVSPGELDSGKYKVFVEIQRDPKLPEYVTEIVDSVKKLTGLERLSFRYYKSFDTFEASLDTLKSKIPLTSDSYAQTIQESSNRNYKNFFSKTLFECNMNKDTLVFRRKYSDRVRLKVLDHDYTGTLLSRIKGPVQLETKDMSEIMFLTKYLGNYNITKINNKFILESNGYAILTEVT
jgi:hypothetical protein